MGQKSRSNNEILLTCFILLLQCQLALLHQDGCLTGNELRGCSTAIKNETLNVECYCRTTLGKANLNNQFGTVSFSMQSTGLVDEILNRSKNATCLTLHVVKVKIQTTKSFQTPTGGDHACPFGFQNYSSSRSLGEFDLTIQLKDGYPMAFMYFNLTCLELSNPFRKNTNSSEIDVTSCKLNEAYLRKDTKFFTHGSEIDLKQKSNSKRDSNSMPSSSPPQDSNPPPNLNSMQYSNSPQSLNLMQSWNSNQNEAESILDFLTYLETKVLSGCNFRFSELTLKSDRVNELPSNLLKKLSEKQVFRVEIHSKRIKEVHNTPLIYSLVKLDLSDCGIRHVENQAFEELTNLRVFILRNNGQSDFHLTNSNPNLETLDLSNRALTHFCGESDWLITMSCRFPNLKKLDLSHNKLERISSQFLEDMIKLESLDLSFNRLRDISYNSIIVNLPNLKYFRLSNNKIHTFLPLASRTETALELLDLSSNEIFSWDESLVGSIAKTKLTLNLRGNQITEVNRWMIKDFNRFKGVHLSGNKFDCNSCTLGDFLYWLQISKHTSTDFPQAPYQCSSPAEHLKEDITSATTIECYKDPEGVSFDYVVNAFIPCAVIVGVLIALGVTFYICRYKIDYCIYITERKLNKPESPVVEDGTIFKQDAFVVHCKDDADWINNHLLPVCGNDDSTLHLSLYDVDSEPGEEDINARIEECGRSVMVISPNFIENRWEQWERQMTTHRLFDHKPDKMIIIILGKLKAKGTPILLQIMMDTEMCLQWPENENGRRLFWRKFKDALGKCHCVRGANENEIRV